MRCYGTEYGLYVRPRAERQCCLSWRNQLLQDQPTTSVMLNVSDSLGNQQRERSRTTHKPQQNLPTHHTGESLPAPGSGAILTTGGDFGLDGAVVLGPPRARFLGGSAASAARTNVPGAPSLSLLSLLSPSTTAMVFLKAMMTCPSPLPMTTP